MSLLQWGWSTVHLAQPAKVAQSIWDFWPTAKQGKSTFPIGARRLADNSDRPVASGRGSGGRGASPGDGDLAKG
jgi:hypothetical protein